MNNMIKDGDKYYTISRIDINHNTQYYKVNNEYSHDIIWTTNDGLMMKISRISPRNEDRLYTNKEFKEIYHNIVENLIHELNTTTTPVDINKLIEKLYNDTIYYEIWNF